MDNKFLKIIAVVFLGLASIVALPWVGGKIKSTKTEKTNNLSVNLSGFAENNVRSIVVKKDGKEKTFMHEDEKWMVGENEADQEKIKNLFQDFSDLKIKEEVSQNEENFENLGVTKDKGYQLIINQDGKDQLFFVGNAGLAAGEFYLRKEGIKNVYLVSGGLRDKLAWEEAKWKK